MKEEHETYILPAYWASYLINGDDSGYSNLEIADIDLFCENNNLGSCLDAEVEDTYFAHSNDANNLGGDVCKFTFFKT